MNNRYCKDCRYCTDIGQYSICNYFLATGIRRPCPGGEGCTVKDSGKKRRTWSVENNATWEKIKQRREEVREQRKRIAVCPECGEEFVTYDPRHIYCSKRCKNQAGWKKQYAAIVEQRKAKQVIRTVVCPECGKEFQTTNPKKIFCSRQCKDRRKNREWRRKEHEKAAE